MDLGELIKIQVAGAAVANQVLLFVRCILGGGGVKRFSANRSGNIGFLATRHVRPKCIDHRRYEICSRAQSRDVKLDGMDAGPIEGEK